MMFFGRSRFAGGSSRSRRARRERLGTSQTGCFAKIRAVGASDAATAPSAAGCSTPCGRAQPYSEVIGRVAGAREEARGMRPIATGRSSLRTSSSSVGGREDPSSTDDSLKVKAGMPFPDTLAQSPCVMESVQERRAIRSARSSWSRDHSSNSSQSNQSKLHKWGRSSRSFARDRPESGRIRGRFEAGPGNPIEVAQS